VKKLIGLAAVTAALAGCAGGNQEPPQSEQVQHAASPEWVTRGPGAFASDKGRAFYGVAIASGIRNRQMRRATADSRARTEIGAKLDPYVSRLSKQYLASAPGGDQGVEQSLKSYAQREVTIVDHWVDNDGSEWSLAQLDVDTFKKDLDKMNELNEQVKRDVRANADRAYSEVTAEDAKQRR
jgi:hypothetical protein